MDEDVQSKIMTAVDTRNAFLLDKLTKIYNNSALDFQYHGCYEVDFQYHGCYEVDFQYQGCYQNRLVQETPLTRAVKNGFYEIIEQLLNAGANVEYPRKHGITPLMIAASRGDLHSCQLLLKSGANIHAVDVCKDTPLHKVIIYNHHSIVALFLEHGALRFHSQDELNNWLLDSHKALHHPISWKLRIIELLVNDLEKQGWDTPLESFFQSAISAACEKCAISLLRQGHYPQQRADKEPVITYFEKAADQGHFQLMKILIELNPVYLQEDWLVENKILFKLSHNTDFLSWLNQHRSHPAQLTHLCRAVILVQLGQNYLPKIGKLPLPKSLKAFLGVVKSEEEC